MSKVSNRLLSAFQAIPEEDSWLTTLFERLPKVVVSNSRLRNPTSSEYNSEWRNCWNDMISNEPIEREDDDNNEGNATGVIEVFEYAKYSYLSVTADGCAPIKIQLNLDDLEFKRLLKASMLKRSNVERDGDELVLISFFSGLVLNVGCNLVALASSIIITGANNEFPPFLIALDGGNQGPVYLSFYATKSSIAKILENDAEAIRQVSFEIHVFDSHISSTALTLGTTRELVGSGGKNYSGDLYDGRNIDHIRNFKKEDKLVTSIYKNQGICKPRIDSSQSGVCVLNIANTIQATFCWWNPGERRTLLILPRLRNSIGDALSYTPAIVSFSTASDSSNFLPNLVLNEDVPARARGPNGTLSFCCLGLCVNKLVKVVKTECFGYLNAKPGLNGFVAYFLGTPIYREMLQYLRQRGVVKSRIQEDLTVPLEEMIERIECKGNTSMRKEDFYVHTLKVLLYCCYIVPKKMECFANFESDDFAEEFLESLFVRKNFVDEDELSSRRCFKYCEADDRFILSHIPEARERSSKRGALCFLQVLAKAGSENARFENLIKFSLQPLENETAGGAAAAAAAAAAKQENHQEATSCKRSKNSL